LPYINTAVALFNYFSLKHVVPSGGDDLDTVKGDLRLTIAKGNEPFTPFNAEEVEHPDPGEVIYVDDAFVMCRRWNWRQGYQTRLNPETRNIAINVDCLPPFSKEKAEEITAELAGLVREFCGGDIKCSLLTIDNNEFEV
jgi:lysyl-tRNA synthetase class 2